MSSQMAPRENWSKVPPPSFMAPWVGGKIPKCQKVMVDHTQPKPPQVVVWGSRGRGPDGGPAQGEGVPDPVGRTAGGHRDPDEGEVGVIAGHCLPGGEHNEPRQVPGQPPQQQRHKRQGILPKKSAPLGGDCNHHLGISRGHPKHCSSTPNERKFCPWLATIFAPACQRDPNAKIF